MSGANFVDRKVRRLINAARNLVKAVNHNLDTKDTIQKYGVPFRELTNLVNAVHAIDNPTCEACNGTGTFQGIMGGPNWPLCPVCDGGRSALAKEQGAQS